jgi:hypothetical protein
LLYTVCNTPLESGGDLGSTGIVECELRAEIVTSS